MLCFELHMLNQKKIVVVLPAYMAGYTLESTYREIPFDIVDEVVLVDDASTDHTLETARGLGITQVIRHERNAGYGANQKSCYAAALALKADIVIMLHPDYQYTPRLIHALAAVIAYDVYPVAFGSRILGKGARKGGMPLYKYISNRILTLMQNILLGQKLSEYHTGYRAYSATVLRSLNLKENSNDFIFDNEIIAQIFMKGYEIGEMTCPTHYFPLASSIDLPRSVKYGLGIFRVTFGYLLHHWGIMKIKLYQPP